MQTKSAQYLTVLEQERGRVREFLELLQQEQAALVAGDHDDLMAYTEQKAARILDLRRLSDTRSRLLASHGLRADKDGMSAWIESHGDEPLRRLWDDIKSLAAQVRAANEINGALVAARLKHNQAAIVALQSAARNGTGVYGPDGGTRLTSATTRALASA
jgi:flagellar biosynthesis protein FlgN